MSQPRSDAAPLSRSFISVAESETTGGLSTIGVLTNDVSLYGRQYAVGGLDAEKLPVNPGHDAFVVGAMVNSGFAL